MLINFCFFLFIIINKLGLENDIDFFYKFLPKGEVIGKLKVVQRFLCLEIDQAENASEILKQGL